MTIEEKAKRYDEAIEKLRSLHDDYDTVSTLIDIKEELERIFPELKESEDERIRKGLIDYLKERKSCESYGQYVVRYDRWIDWLENQGKKKSADKFHEGDWIVRSERNSVPFKILKITPLDYEVVNIFGYHHTITKFCVNEYYRLWTIQDAKDGDVVVNKSDGAIGIFEVGHHDDGGSYNDPSDCFLHCRYDKGFFYADFEDGNTIDSYDLVPATKEQRDTLMKAMTDAGYTFDFEKKELKKLREK